RQKSHIHSMLGDVERLQAVGERVFVAGEQSPRSGAVEQKLRKLRPRQVFRRRAVCERSQLGDLRLVGFLAVEDGGDIRNRARRRDERGANFDRNVPGGVGLGRRRRGNAGGLLLFFADNTRAHDRGATCLFRFFKFWSDGG